jgi:hypothetical protein
MECRVGSCNLGDGACTISNAPRRTRCSNGFCDLLGNCQQCLEDTDCQATQFCSAWQCAERPPLTTTAACLVTINIGHALQLAWGTTLTGFPVVAKEGTTILFTLVDLPPNKGRHLLSASTRVRTFSVEGPSGTTCQGSVVDSMRIKVSFRNTSESLELWAVQD